MTKRVLSVLSLLLCLSLLLTTFGTVQAKSAVASSLPQPTITPLTGNPTYTTKLLPVKDMPGVTALDSGKFFPVGYESGEKQFEGPGLQISNFSGGSATLCFPLEGIKSGWGGQVGIWNGSKWELLATTINPAGDEIPYSWACTVIYGSGTFAMIKWIADPTLLSKPKPDCGYAIVGAMPGIAEYSDIDGVITGTIISILMITDPSVDISGTSAKISVKFDPKAISVSPASTQGVILPWGTGFYLIGLTNPITFSVSKEFSAMYMHLDFGSCKQTVTMSIG